MPRRLTSVTSLENLKKEAKRWLKALRANEAEARARFERAYPAAPVSAGLRDVQYALAREYGHESWVALKQAVGKAPADGVTRRARTVEDYERLAGDLVLAHDSRDEAALRRVNEYYRRSFTFDDLSAEVWRRVYAFRQRSSRVPKNYLELAEAQTLIAQDAGFGSWEVLMQAVATGAPPAPAHAVDRNKNRIAPRRQLSDKEWDELIEAMKERRITALEANGLMTDALLARIAELDHVTSLGLGGSRQLSDDGLLHLVRMPQLQHLNLTEYPGGRITDRGLEVLRHLSNLRTFEMSWQSGITDRGAANLRFCDQLERVNLMGTHTGDGTIEALRGKPKLSHFKSGRLVTDAGLALLHDFPVFNTWRGADVQYSLMTSPDEDPSHLLIDGPFCNKGLASVAQLEGLCGLKLVWQASSVTSDAFRLLSGLPHLLSLRCDGELCDDIAMRHIAAMPRLRMLVAQGTPTTDGGFKSLSRSRTIEQIWAHECPNLGSAGFVALSQMPALRGLGISCGNVNDQALAILPQFPELRELMPGDVKDNGFQHVGRCKQLERLWCMYCRETTDVATEHIAELRLKYYYAGMTQITDRSLEILGCMPSLEQVEFYQCRGVTNAGLIFLAGLPRLREVALHSLPSVTLAGTEVFPSHVRVEYSL